LAGLAVGFWPNQSEIASHWQVDRKFAPAMKPPVRKKLCAGWMKALERAKAWEK
jgi:glycerol kinase